MSRARRLEQLAFLLLAGAAFAVAAWEARTFPDRARIFPQVVAVTGALLVLVEIAWSAVRRRREPPGEVAAKEEFGRRSDDLAAPEGAELPMEDGPAPGLHRKAEEEPEVAKETGPAPGIRRTAEERPEGVLGDTPAPRVLGVAAEETGGFEDGPTFLERVRAAARYLLWLAAYYLAIYLLGFVQASVLFVFLFLVIEDRMRWTRAVAAAVPLLLVLLLLGRTLGVRWPIGQLEYLIGYAIGFR